MAKRAAGPVMRGKWAGQALAILLALAAARSFVRHLTDLERFIDLARQTRSLGLPVALFLQVGTCMVVALSCSLVPLRGGSRQRKGPQ